MRSQKHIIITAIIAVMMFPSIAAADNIIAIYINPQISALQKRKANLCKKQVG